MTPVRRTPSLRTNIAKTVSVAGFENPEMPCSGDTPVHSPRRESATTRPTAVASIGTGWVTEKTKTMAMIASTTTTSSETGNCTGSSCSGHPVLKEREEKTALVYLLSLKIAWIIT
jgi:hypothetical protein